jgi:TonB family protein
LRAYGIFDPTVEDHAMMLVALAVLASMAAGQDPTTPAATPPAAPVEVSPLVVRPKAQAPANTTVKMDSGDDWIHKPDNALILSIWPTAAFQARIDGHAVLTCKVDVYGLAEECRVASESPPGKGFGAAALLLRPSFKLKPAMGPHGPVEAMMNIPIEFKNSDNDDISFNLPGGGPGANMDTRQMTLNGTRPEMREVTMLDHPVWAAAAGFEDLAKAYPAKGGGVEGFAVAHCRVERSGALSGCEPRKEVPENRGFALAAVSLAKKFRVSQESATAPHRTPLWVDIPVRFPSPAEAGDRTVASPTWVAGFDPEKVLKLFPPEAAARGLTSGRGVARCVVGVDGALTECEPLPGDPDGVGFSEAAVKLASKMRMNPWTAAGGPVDGAVVRLPIRFNLAAKKD